VIEKLYKIYLLKNLIFATFSRKYKLILLKCGGRMLKAKENINVLVILMTLALFYIIINLPFPSIIKFEAQVMIAILIMAVIFWVSESLPLAVTGVLIIFLQAVFGIKPISEGLTYFAHPIFTLVFAGFFIAAAISMHKIDRRFSLQIILFMGEKTDRLILGIMITTAFLSMWVSNTTATVIVLPIAIDIIKLADVKKITGSNFSKAMMIGVVFAATIGGMGTPVGTPACTITIAYLSDMANINISFLEWMLMAVPIVIILIPISWKLLCYVLFPLEITAIKGGSDTVRKQLKELGELTNVQKHVIILFFLAVVLWSLDTFLPLMEDWLYIASMIIALMFIIPKIGVIQWKEAINKVQWGIIFLIGGGLSLGSGLEDTGLIHIVTETMAYLLKDLNVYLLTILMSIVAAISITFFCSFAVTAVTFVPIAIGLAFQLEINPAILGIAAGLGSCLAFLLPANAAPNAIAYSYGYFKTHEMIKAGIPHLIFAAIIVTIFNVLRLFMF